MMFSTHSSTIYKKAKMVIEKLQKSGFKAYFVGGCFRDSILGYSLKDIDIATSATPEDVSALFPKTYHIGAAFGIINVIDESFSFEVATFRKESGYADGRHPGSVVFAQTPEEDAKRIDFTINALYYDPVSEECLDFTGGVKDLKNGVIRCIGKAEDRFAEDSLRMLRAIRFASRFGFEIDSDILNAIKKLSDRIRLLSKERIRDELTKTFTGHFPDRAFQLLYDTGIMEIIMPEIAAMRGVSQPEKYHPEGDVFEHTKLMLQKMALPSEELAWAIILHDVGKPVTKTVDEHGKERFICHDDKGKDIARDILERLKFSRLSTENICYAVANHMRFAVVDEMRPSKYKNIIAKDTFPMELELHRIDCISSNGLLQNFVFLLDKIIEQRGQTKLPPSLISGKDLLKIGLIPGPEFGHILKKITELQNDKIINTKEEALEYIKNFEF